MHHYSEPVYLLSEETYIWLGCVQVVAVLAAVSEEIKSRGGSESNTEYFAALVSLTFQLFCLYCIVPLILNVC